MIRFTPQGWAMIMAMVCAAAAVFPYYMRLGKPMYAVMVYFAPIMIALLVIIDAGKGGHGDD